MSATAQAKKKGFDPTVLNTDKVVMWFDDLGTGNEEYRFLSNFYEGEPITLPGVVWPGDYETDPVTGRPTGFWSGSYRSEYREKADFKHDQEPVQFATGEHAFQALKVTGRDVMGFYKIATADGPNEAKYQGRTCELRPDWEAVKYDLMAAIIRAKFTPEREEGQRLLDTGDRLLVEGTFWGDEVWGVDLTVRGMPGRNWLGTLLMARRAELRAAALGAVLFPHEADNVALAAHASWVRKTK